MYSIVFVKFSGKQLTESSSDNIEAYQKLKQQKYLLYRIIGLLILTIFITATVILIHWYFARKDLQITITSSAMSTSQNYNIVEYQLPLGKSKRMSPS
jgi:hypothetical protein